MRTRNARFLAVALTGALLTLVVLIGLRWSLPGGAIPTDTADASAATPLPVPPVPPRLATGERYEQCLAMVADDPRGAAVFAASWTGGGDAALHCQALADIALGDVETGAGHLERLAAASTAPPAPRAEVFAQAAEAWLVAGNAARSFAVGTAALALAPDNPDLLIGHAVAAVSLRRYESAVDDLTHALDTDRRRVDILVLRATAWRNLDQLELAQDDIDRATAIDPDDAEALLERGVLRQRRNDPGGARADWDRAIDLAPDTATADLAEQNLSLLDAGPERR